MEQHWFITGVSGGLGLAMALEAAKRGHKVAGTLRKKEQIEEFEAIYPGQFKGILLDVRQKEKMQSAVYEVLEFMGSIDVLVNNAGYGLVGAVEELSENEIRDQMEVNFFGALFLSQLVLAEMRKNRKGHIFNISSIAGVNGSAGLALYNASKFALEGFSEGLMLETRHLGIKVSLVEPGPFRTAWAGGGLVHAEKQLDDYASVTRILRDRLANVNGKQAGDPERAAKLICDVALRDDAPLRLLLGAPGYQVVEAKLKRQAAEYQHWKAEGLATDFPT
jgi:NAD(P)-dependent dehydrogenase (short-subunit alcohol dehydrogenase family)